MKLRRLLLGVLALLWPWMALAEGAEMTVTALPEIGVSVPVPYDFITFTRDMPQGDARYAQAGVDENAVRDFLQGGSYYLSAFSPVRSQQITVYAVPDEQTEFGALERADLQAIASGMAQNLSGLGLTVEQAAVYQTSNATYILMWQQDANAYRMVCYTRRQGMMYTISLISPSRAVAPEDEAQLISVLEGVAFTGVMAASAAPTEAPVEVPPQQLAAYASEVTRVSFLYPEAWAQVETAAGPMSAGFVPAEGCTVLLVCRDLWAEGLEAALAPLGFDRYDVNMNWFNAKQAAAAFGTSVDAVNEAVYGGRFFYRTSIGGMAYGKLFVGPMVMTVENGYMYNLFCDFSGDPLRAQHEAEFEALLGSLSFGW